MEDKSTTSPQIPTWLGTPADSIPNPPVVTRVQELPFSELTWENFERLCLRLAKLESDVEHCQLYGTRGQRQHGIDLYARRRSPDGYCVFQCKRENKFSSTKIKSAVKRFREGDWFGKADTLILCTTETLAETSRAHEVEKQSEILQSSGVTFIPWDSLQLSVKLKGLPLIVDDFFGRQWVRLFCGEAAAKALDARLDGVSVAEFRRRLGSFYGRLFNNHDPGLPLLSGFGDENALPIEDRFVLPDVDDRRILGAQFFDNRNSETTDADAATATSSEARFAHRGRNLASQRRAASYEHRQSIDKWLATRSRSVILGGPGSGKSSLLRFLVTDLLKDEPRLHVLAEKWGQYLPVWVPFAYWTKKIAAPESSDISLNNAIEKWLTSWGELRLWPLVERALEDERLLLFVDGFDEYSDDSSARLALSRLQVFAEQRNLPVVATSRPHGFEQLNMQTGWEVGTLSDFSQSQQEQLAHIWFKHWTMHITSAATDADEALGGTIGRQVVSFSKDLKNSADLRQLAKIPLLLSLLIAHKLHDVQLPQSRFKAYESLIEHLLFTHPKKRRFAASLSGPSCNLSDMDMKSVLAYLAFRVHQDFSEGIFGHEEARAIVIDYLRDTESGFGLDAAESRKISGELLQIGESTLGLIVRKSHGDLGFFHRTFQEYLAATHLSTMAFDEQLTIVESRCVDPQWRESILALLHLTSRPEDVKNFLNRLQQKTTNVVERFSIDVLLGEIAFGDFKCGVVLAREIANHVAHKIEVGTWMPHRERLLRQALEGLRSTKLKEFVKAKLTVWFPDRTRWNRQKIFSEMGNWDCTADVVGCLWKGFYDEASQNMRAAARALAVVASRDDEVGNRVANLGWSEVDPVVRGVAIECLLNGWPQHEKIERILGSARKSAHPVLRLFAISGKVRRGDHDGTDLRELFFLGSFEAGLDYDWREELARVLVSGWSGSNEVKRRCLDALEHRNIRDFELDVARLVLVGGFPQDNEVAKHFAQKLNEEYFHVPTLYPRDNEEDFFDTLVRNFQGHPLIAPAADRYCQRNLERDYLTYYHAALVGRSPRTKEVLLSGLHKRPCPIVPVLLRGWGMEDSEVRQRLGALAFGPTSDASAIADQIPSIIDNKERSRSRLLELLRDPTCTNKGTVLSGLIALGNTRGDTEVVDLVLNSLEADPHESLTDSLIRGYSFDARVRNLAKNQFSESHRSLDAIASVYGEDEELKELVMQAVTPLPSSLRTLIVTRLGEGLGEDDFALGLLENYDRDQDSNVKAEAAFGYYNRLKNSGRETESAIKRLEREISSDFDLGAGRQAAFCGLAILRRVDVMKNAQLARPDLAEKRVRVPVSEVGEAATIPFLKTLLQDWSYVRDVFGEEFWFRFASYSPDVDRRPVWRELCLFADEYPLPSEEARAFFELRKNDREVLNVNVLSFLDRTLPKTRLLLDYCLLALRSNRETPHYSSDEALFAVELLGKHFGGDADVLKEIMTLNASVRSASNIGDDKQLIPENFILALCEGWPGSEEMRDVNEMLYESQQRLTYRTCFQLASRWYSPKEIFQYLRAYLRLSKRSELLRFQTIARFVVRRLKKDEELSDLLLQRLRSTPSALEKTAFPRLLALAGGDERDQAVVR